MHNPSWLDACAEFARANALSADCLKVLRCFAAPWPRGGPPAPAEAPWDDRFEALEALLLTPAWLDGAQRLLEQEVDAEQAAIFLRRLETVDAELCRQAQPEARIWRVGLRQRLQEILAASSPRALRLRALADFYYSQALCLAVSAGDSKADSSEALRALEWRAQSLGLWHGLLEGRGPRGPWHVNLLRVDPRRVRIEVRDCSEETAAGEPFASYVSRSGAAAGVSGGYFLYSEPDIQPPSARYDPVGLLLTRGVLRSAPVFRRACLWISERGEAQIERRGLSGLTVELAGHSLTINEPVWNRARAPRGPDHPSLAIVGERVIGVGRELPIPLNGFVLPVAPALMSAVQVGARLRFGALRAQSGARWREAIAGGPLLLDEGQPALDMRGEDFWGSAPPVTFSQDETGDRNLLPRLAVGQRRSGELIFAAVDGRNPRLALGMTLGDCAQLLQALGCQRATNLDGGSSKRMVVSGAEVDLSSTEIVSGQPSPQSVRPVRSAVLFFAGEPEQESIR